MGWNNLNTMKHTKRGWFWKHAFTKFKKKGFYIHGSKWKIMKIKNHKGTVSLLIISPTYFHILISTGVKAHWKHLEEKRRWWKRRWWKVMRPKKAKKDINQQEEVGVSPTRKSGPLGSIWIPLSPCSSWLISSDYVTIWEIHNPVRCPRCSNTHRIMEKNWHPKPG